MVIKTKLNQRRIENIKAMKSPASFALAGSNRSHAVCDFFLRPPSRKQQSTLFLSSQFLHTGWWLTTADKFDGSKPRPCSGHNNHAPAGVIERDERLAHEAISTEASLAKEIVINS
jgi:hypothetical protein